MRGARSVLLAVLIVAASVVGSVGLVGSSAAQTDTYAQEFTTGPHKVEVDLSNVTTETTISVVTSESPAGDNATIMKKTVPGSTTSAHFRNAGAYQEFTMKVSGADAKPGFSKGGPPDAWLPGDPGKFLGDTGGDADFTYDLSEQIGESVMPQIVQLDRTGLPGSTTVDTSGLNTQDAKLEIYQSAQNHKAGSEGIQTTMSNYLSDTKTQARIIGKNAYIRALNNGSSKAAAKTEAKSAVSEYYSTKEENLLNEWERSHSQQQYLESKEGSAGLSSDFVSHTVPETYDPKFTFSFAQDSTTFTFVNGTSTTVTATQVTVEDTGGTPDTQTYIVGPEDGFQDNLTADAEAAGDYSGVDVNAPTSDYTNLQYRENQQYADLFQTIDSQNTQVQSDMDTLAENTYSAYENGEINSSDLVDPYVLASQQSAGSDFQGWAAAQLTLTGTNSPENFDQIGSFNITASDGTQYEGVLFSQDNPTSGQFEAGQSYDASTLGGTQYVVTSDEIVELTGTFTVDDITDKNGQTLQNATIQKTQYQTTNTTELKQLYEDLAYKRAQIEAREQALAGGGGFNFGGSTGPIAIVAVAGAAFLLLKD